MNEVSQLVHRQCFQGLCFRGLRFRGLCFRDTHCFCSLSMGIFNALKRYSSQEAMVEFSGEKKLKLSLSARQKPRCKIYIERSRYFFIRRKRNSPITSHAKLALCKERMYFRIFAEGRESHVSQTNRVFFKRSLQLQRGSCYPRPSNQLEIT